MQNKIEKVLITRRNNRVVNPIKKTIKSVSQALEEVLNKENAFHYHSHFFDTEEDVTVEGWENVYLVVVLEFRK